MGRLRWMLRKVLPGGTRLNRLHCVETCGRECAVSSIRSSDNRLALSVRGCSAAKCTHVCMCALHLAYLCACVSAQEIRSRLVLPNRRLRQSLDLTGLR